MSTQKYSFIIVRVMIATGLNLTAHAIFCHNYLIQRYNYRTTIIEQGIIIFKWLTLFIILNSFTSPDGCVRIICYTLTVLRLVFDLLINQIFKDFEEQINYWELLLDHLMAENTKWPVISCGSSASEFPTQFREI